MRLTGDWEAWLGFFVAAVTETAGQAVSCAQQLNRLLADDKSKLASLGRQSGSATQILDALFSHPIANIGRLSDQTGLTPATVGKALEALVGIGIVRELTGQKRNRMFAYTGYIEILNQDTH